MQTALAFLDETVFPALAQRQYDEALALDNAALQSSLSSDEPAAAGQQILPNRLPLKRRLAEFRHGMATTSSISTWSATPSTAASISSSGSSVPATTCNEKQRTNLWAVERFRDIATPLVVAVFDDALVLEPGDIGPLPLGHAVAQELIACINTQRLSLAMLTTLRDHGAPFYDGGVVVGVVDYRRWAFVALAPPSASASSASARHADIPTPGGGRRPAPEMHKILLRTPYTTLTADVHAAGVLPDATPADTDRLLEMEARILVCRLHMCAVCI